QLHQFAIARHLLFVKSVSCSGVLILFRKKYRSFLALLESGFVQTDEEGQKSRNIARFLFQLSTNTYNSFGDGDQNGTGCLDSSTVCTGHRNEHQKFSPLHPSFLKSKKRKLTHS